MYKPLYIPSTKKGSSSLNNAGVTRTLCSFLPLTLPSPEYDHTSPIQTYTQCTKLHTGFLGPQPQHLGKYHHFFIYTCTHSPATHTPTLPSRTMAYTPPLTPTPTLDTYKHYNNHTLHAPASPLHFPPTHTHWQECYNLQSHKLLVL